MTETQELSIGELIEIWDRQGEQEVWRGSVLLECLRKFNIYPHTGAEVGVFCGTLSSYLLQNCEDLKLYMVDRWLPDQSATYAESGDILANLDFNHWKRIKKRAEDATLFAADRRKICQGDSSLSWGFSNLDFVFIDAAHDYESVLRDIRKWAALVRPGGLISGHDWGSPSPSFEVERAVKQYARENEGINICIGPDGFWGFVKP